MFFKGFVETKNKKCIEKFKGRTDFKTFEQVQSLPEYAGILATETILIDIDDSETSEILFKVVKEYALTCRVYKPAGESISYSRTAEYQPTKQAANWQ